MNLLSLPHIWYLLLRRRRGESVAATRCRGLDVSASGPSGVRSRCLGVKVCVVWRFGHLAAARARKRAVYGSRFYLLVLSILFRGRARRSQERE